MMIRCICCSYLDRIEELTGTPIRWVSVGTRRSQIIEVS
jgi:adenylosuccinate synthase